MLTGGAGKNINEYTVRYNNINAGGSGSVAENYDVIRAQNRVFVRMNVNQNAYDGIRNSGKLAAAKSTGIIRARYLK